MQASRARCEELNLPRSEKKAFDKLHDFKAWGTCVSSASGRVGAPHEKRQIEVLATELIREGKASKKALQKLIGLVYLSTRSCIGANACPFFITFTVSWGECLSKG